MHVKRQVVLHLNRSCARVEFYLPLLNSFFLFRKQLFFDNRIIIQCKQHLLSIVREICFTWRKTRDISACMCERTRYTLFYANTIYNWIFSLNRDLYTYIQTYIYISILSASIKPTIYADAHTVHTFAHMYCLQSLTVLYFLESLHLIFSRKFFFLLLLLLNISCIFSFKLENLWKIPAQRIIVKPKHSEVFVKFYKLQKW